jgi:hypothetical protein
MLSGELICYSIKNFVHYVQSITLIFSLSVAAVTGAVWHIKSVSAIRVCFFHADERTLFHRRV